MMQRDDNGVSNFLIHEPEATVVELTVDFGNGFIRTLGMKRSPDGAWTVSVHGVSEGVRYRFRIDGRSCPEPDAIVEGPGGWTRVARAA